MADEEQGELPVVQMIDLAASHQFNKATEIFNDLIGQKMNDRLEQEKIAMANQVFNGAIPEDEEEYDDDQGELDLDDEEEYDDDEEYDDEEYDEEELEDDDIEVDEADVDEDDSDYDDEEESRED